VLQDHLLQGRPAQVPQLLGGHVRGGVDRRPYVGPQFHREATEAGSKRQPGLLEEPVEEPVSTGQHSEGLPDVLSEDWQYRDTGLKSRPGEAQPLLPEDRVMVVTELGLVYTPGGDTQYTALLELLCNCLHSTRSAVEHFKN